MIPEDEVSAEDEGEVEYEFSAPDPVMLSDSEGQVLILDPSEWHEKYIALQYRGGTLFGLDRETMRWVDVEAPAPTKERKFKTVQ